MRHLLALAALLSLLAVPLSAAEPDPPPYEPTSNYEKRDVRGWTVYVNRRLLDEEKDVGRQAVELLEAKLYDVVRALPEKPLTVLRTIPIWMEVEDRLHPCACYHPDRDWLVANGYNPEKTDCVEIANAATFLDWSRQQPSMVLHELVHGYHDRMPDGYHNRELVTAYQRAKKSGKYDSVLHGSGRRVKAYAMNNPQEYFAELSEAWFGANDFYPFVRSEVFEHDPDMARLLGKIWHDADHTPTADYREVELEGWKVRLHPALDGDRAALGREALKLLEMKLYDITQRVPAAAVEQLRQTPIWLEADGGPCCYHPARDWLIDHNINPDKTASVEIGNAEHFLQTVKRQPMVVLHELAHAYHHRVLGHAHPGIKQAYQQARRSKSYEAVLNHDGRRVPAYALSNEKEYFAESSETYFGTNDFYPFVRAELIEHDPEMAALLREVWEAKGETAEEERGEGEKEEGQGGEGEVASGQ